MFIMVVRCLYYLSCNPSGFHNLYNSSPSSFGILFAPAHVSGSRTFLASHTPEPGRHLLVPLTPPLFWHQTQCVELYFHTLSCQALKCPPHQQGCTCLEPSIRDWGQRTVESWVSLGYKARCQQTNKAASVLPSYHYCSSTSPSHPQKPAASPRIS